MIQSHYADKPFFFCNAQSYGEKANILGDQSDFNP
jgi:hypothetical protein